MTVIPRYTFIAFFDVAVAIIKFPVMKPNLMFAKILESTFESKNFVFVPLGF